MWIEVNLPWKKSIERPKELEELYKIFCSSSNFSIEEKREASEKHNNIYNEWRKKEKEISFWPLASTGTVIQYNKNGELITELIGDLNKIGGYCDDCKIADNTIILRYKKIDWK